MAKNLAGKNPARNVKTIKIMYLNKINIPVAIVLAAIIIGGFFYAVQINKQKSIEKQQQLQLEQARQAAEAKSEQDKKEYIAKRKADCLDIYKTESNKWNNVRGWRYDEIDETCYIRYKDLSPKSDSKCDELFPTSNGERVLSFFFRENALCKDGEFENSF